MKKKKKRIILLIILAVIIVIAAVSFINKPQTQAVETATVENGNIASTYSFSGTIEATSMENLVVPAATKIDTLYVAEGDNVEKDDRLFSTTDGTVYRASVDGTVTDLGYNEDESVAAGEKVLSVVDFSSLQIPLKVDEYDITAMKVGKNAAVTINALNKSVTGSLTKVSKTAAAGTGISTFAVDVSVPNTDGLCVGMSADVKIEKDSAQNVPIVDVSAISYNSDGTAYATLQKSDGTTEERDVTLGIEDGKKVQILSGLAVGDTVVLNKATTNTVNFGSSRQSDATATPSTTAGAQSTGTGGTQ
jgi:multidrug efflux pump subunit AcrA (membrane-fusion protein)